MATGPIERNKLTQLKTKIALLEEKLHFLKTCKRINVLPKFIRVVLPKHCDKYIANKLKCTSESLWLNLEIKSVYKQLTLYERLAYELHLKIIKGMNKLDFEIWERYARKMYRVIDEKRINKKRTLCKKLNSLTNNNNSKTTVRPLVKFIPNYVINKSQQHLSSEEECLLNRGLNFALVPIKLPTDDLIANIELATHKMDRDNVILTKTLSKRILSDAFLSHKPSLEKTKIHKTVKSLREKNCFFLKADKGNSVVIVEKEEYFQNVEEMINSGPYKELSKNPLPKMILDVREARKNMCSIFDPSFKWRLGVSNPSIPRLYALPKVHKPGNTFRPIVSNINAPSSNISKWLVSEFNKLNQPEGFYVKNTKEFVNKVKDVTIGISDSMVSFDVTALFPNVPITETLIILRKWLESNDIPLAKIDLYIRLTKMCMDQNCFLFNGKIYQQTFGTSMGNSLSPFLANLFMANLEKELQKSQVFPRVWVRYVDDIFAVIGKNQLRRILKLLNSHTTSIKFTHEEEKDNKIPFLDVWVIRNGDRVEFDIYRKTSTTDRYITSDSNHCHAHKRAAFCSMVHRLVSIPLTAERFNKELEKIKSIANTNGYVDKMVEDILTKALKAKAFRNITTLRPTIVPSFRRSRINYIAGVSKKLKREFHKADVALVETSDLQLKNLLGSAKDKIPFAQRSGIYSIDCDYCDKIYIGQSRRAIGERFKEHLAHIKWGRPEKSAVAQHAFDENHTFREHNLKLVEVVQDRRKLDVIESITILKNAGRTMNQDNGPTNSLLFGLIK